MTLCPNCEIEMMLLVSRVYRHRNGEPKKVLQCPCCDCRHGCHPSGEPVGTPADRETRNARIRVHDLIDPLWRDGCMSRNAVYRMMQQVMGREIHVGLLSKAECEEVEEKILDHLAFKMIRETGRETTS